MTRTESRSRKNGALVQAAAALTLCLAAAACSDNKKQPAEPFMPPEDQVTSMDKFAAGQAAAGARADAMLYAHHFDGNQLNALGRSKIYLVTRDTPADQPIVLYMNLAPSDPLSADRQASVQKYLGSIGIASDKVQLKTGANLAELHPAMPSIQRLPKTETGSMDSGGSRPQQPTDQPPSER